MDWDKKGKEKKGNLRSWRSERQYVEQNKNQVVHISLLLYCELLSREISLKKGRQLVMVWDSK